MKKNMMALVIMMALVSLPNMSAYKQAVSAVSKMQSSGIKVETGYKPTVPGPEDVYDPQNPILYPREYN